MMRERTSALTVSTKLVVSRVIDLHGKDTAWLSPKTKGNGQKCVATNLDFAAYVTLEFADGVRLFVDDFREQVSK